MSLSNEDKNIIKEGDFVLLKTESVVRLVELKNNKPQYLGKRKARFFACVGFPFGSFFEVRLDGTLQRIENFPQTEDLLSTFEDIPEIKDNRALINTNQSQRLTTSDIETFKKQGLSGQELVKKIVENSSSFQEKTQFAKEKYLRKKQKKYINCVQILRPNIRLLAEMYYMQGPLKICNMRLDSLSQMLAFCNIRSGGKYIVMDSVMGLLTAALLERVGKVGCVVQVNVGPFSIQAFQQVIRALNIPNDQLKSILYNVDMKTAREALSAEEQTDMIVDAVENVPGERESLSRLSKIEKMDHIKRAKEILAFKSMDSLLIAIKHHPANALCLLDLLSSSRPFAIFSMFQSTLVDCYVQLKSRGDILSLNISETWLRRYQVLPDRTHPCYSMSGNSGFLLTGIKVDPKPPV